MGQVKLDNFFCVHDWYQPPPITKPGSDHKATSQETHLITVFPRGGLPKWEGRNTNN